MKPANGFTPLGAAPLTEKNNGSTRFSNWEASQATTSLVDIYGQYIELPIIKKQDDGDFRQLWVKPAR